MALNTNGDGSVYINGTNGSVRIGAGSEDRLTVGAGGVTVANQLTVQGDLNAASGQSKEYRYYSYRTLQGSTPFMTASSYFFSGTAAAVGTQQFIYTKQALRGSGSLLGLTLFSEDGTVKSGSLTASVYINAGASALGSVIITTGSISSVTYAKDAATFNGSSLMTVVLTCSSGYLTDVALSCSWTLMAEVEF